MYMLINVERNYELNYFNEVENTVNLIVVFRIYYFICVKNVNLRDFNSYNLQLPKCFEKIKKKKSRTLGIPRRSPIQVLTEPDVA